MPRRDRTFSGEDVIRIILIYLTADEREQVLRFFSGSEVLQPKTPDTAGLLQAVEAVEKVLVVLKPIAILLPPTFSFLGLTKVVLLGIVELLETVVNLLKLFLEETG